MLKKFKFLIFERLKSNPRDFCGFGSFVFCFSGVNLSRTARAWYPTAVSITRRRGGGGEVSVYARRSLRRRCQRVAAATMMGRVGDVYIHARTHNYTHTCTHLHNAWHRMPMLGGRRRWYLKSLADGNENRRSRDNARRNNKLGRIVSAFYRRYSKRAVLCIRVTGQPPAANGVGLGEEVQGAKPHEFHYLNRVYIVLYV